MQDASKKNPFVEPEQEGFVCLNYDSPNFSTPSKNSGREERTERRHSNNSTPNESPRWSGLGLGYEVLFGSWSGPIRDGKKMRLLCAG